MSFAEKSLQGLFEAAGGEGAFHRLSDAFHRLALRDPLLAPLFPANTDRLDEHLAQFLAEFAGGPDDYTRARGKQSLLCRHAHLAIGPDEAARWISLMQKAMEDTNWDPAIRDRVLAQLHPAADSLADPLLAFYGMPLEHLKLELERDPGLARLNDHGRNLICRAARNWDADRLGLLLDHGANVCSLDAAGHDPVYWVCNGQGEAEDMGIAALRTLIAHGAGVSSTSGVGGMTPLHMAARRGNVTLACELLNHGAPVDAQDNGGQTALRRAVNCGQAHVARLLLQRGANPDAADRRGVTPAQAARTATMAMLFKR